MATVTNPTVWPLWCQALGRELRPHERATRISQAVAEEATHTGVFVIGEDDPEPQGETSTPPRERVTRGAKATEVTKPPRRERR